MVTDSNNKFTVIGYPRALSKGLVHEEQGLVGNGGTVKAELGCNNTVLRGSAVDGAVSYGSELNSVFSVKNNAVNSVWEFLVCNSVENDRANCHLSSDSPEASAWIMRESP